MHIVIEISEEDYKGLQRKDKFDDMCLGYCEKLIVHGTQLPKGHGRLTNSEWIDFLSEQFDISRTSAKEMLHTMMSVKREDNFKKIFSQGRK